MNSNQSTCDDDRDAKIAEIATAMITVFQDRAVAVAERQLLEADADTLAAKTWRRIFDELLRRR